jgi:DDE superfamily endonuclease
MEDVLALYAEAYNARRPKVNFDETSRQLIADRHPPLAVSANHPQREDHEYERKGTRNLFIVCEPQAGWRQVTVTERRTKQDFAQQMQWLVGERYPQAEVIRVILDNLNTHGPGSLYDAFEPAEARRLVPIRITRKP